MKNRTASPHPPTILLIIFIAMLTMWGLLLPNDLPLTAISAEGAHALNRTIGENLLQNGDFSNEDVDWFSSGAADASTGELCVMPPAGTENPWDAQVGQGGFALQSGVAYQVDLQMRANSAASIALLISENQEPWEQFFYTTLDLAIEEQPFRAEFVLEAPADIPDALFVLHLGETAATEFCLDNVSLRRVDPEPAQIIFDDFAYNSEELGLAHRADTNSIFGTNPWTTENGEINSRFWRRYNWDDLDFEGNAVLRPSDEGMDLSALAGYATTQRDPEIFSGVAFPNRGHGSYHARIKFDDLEDEVRAIQAFWTYSVNRYAFTDAEDNYIPEGFNRGYSYETDIEWNNWFDGDGLSRLSSANHTGSGNFANENLQCIYRDADGNETHFPDCVGDVGGEELIPNQWVNALIVIDDVAETVAYSLWIDNWRGSGGELWIGGPAADPQWGAPMVLQTYFPQTPMIPVFSQHFFAPEGEETQTLSQEHALGIDYFYYSTRTDLGPDDVEAAVAELRADGLVRVNTTGFAYQEVNSGSPYEVRIDGPETLSPNQRGEWTFSATLTSTRFETQYRYRLQTTDQGWGAWQYIAALRFSKVADGSFDQMEIEAVAKNFWHDGQVESATRLVQVVDSSTSDIPTIYLPLIVDAR